MKNDDMNTMNGSDDRMHELLCKVVFGEADEAERKEVEAALAASPELRAQKADLEATASLVRSSMGAELKLSESAVESVLAAASAAQSGDGAAGEAASGKAPEGKVITRTPWFRRPVLRAAAAVALLGGAYVWIQSGGNAPEVDLEARAEAERITNERLASSAGAVEPGVADSGRGGSGPGLEIIALNGFGHSTGNPIQESTALGGFHPKSSPAGESTSRTLGMTSDASLIPSDVDMAQAALVEFKEAFPDMNGQVLLNGEVERSLRGNGYADSAVNAQNEWMSSGSSAKSWTDKPVVGTTVTRPPAAVDSTKVMVDALSVASTTGAGPATKPSGPSTPGQTRLFFEAAGGGAAPAGTPAVRARRRTPGSHGGTYRGPGDSVPPAGPSGMAVNSSPGMGGGGGGGHTTSALIGFDTGFDDSSRSSWHQPAADVSLYGPSGGFGRGAFSQDDRRCLRHNPAALPNERPRDMFFRFWGDNPYVVTERDKLSTFAADVDTASFVLAKRMLKEGKRPQRAQIRTEEFVNFLKPDLAAPTEDTFAVHAELSPSPFGGREDRYLLRVGVRAKEIKEADRPPLALTFVVDTSGSMRENNRLELVKHSMRLLVDKLDARDTIAIARFSSDASIVLPPTPATARDVIETALFGLQPDGSTNAEAGLKLGYELADQSLREGAQSRVVFLSDGVANVGQTDQDRIAADVAASTERGVFLNTIGVGMSNHNDVFLEQMADKGQGVCDYIGGADDARRAIVERFVGGFVTVAKDVKIQVEFDPAVVLRWRQLGYENRAVADKDFRNDKVDAGEIGAGHQVTCLYEIELSSVDARREQPMATARVRWKPVDPAAGQPATEATEKAAAFRYDEVAAASFRAASEGFRRSALAAQFAEALRDSIHTSGDSVEELGRQLGTLLAEDRHEDTATVAEMCRQAIGLGLRSRPAHVVGDDEQAHRDAYYDELIKSLGGDPGQDTETATAEPRDKESRIRELIEGNSGRKAH